MTIINETTALSLPPHALLQDASLFLDFDGTLVAIAARPDAVVVEARLRRLLANLRQWLRGRLAIVSGRASADVGMLLGDPGLVIAGSHGAELPGAAAAVALDGAALTLLAELGAKHPGILVEHKPAGLALHFRQAPDAEAACRAAAAQLAGRTGLALQPGKMVVELRPAGRDKGTALAALMAQAPLRDGRPVFIGDDETDEAGFRMAAAHGGAGILVGEPRPTAARYRLPGVDATLAWLETAMAGAS